MASNKDNAEKSGSTEGTVKVLPLAMQSSNGSIILTPRLNAENKTGETVSNNIQSMAKEQSSIITNTDKTYDTVTDKRVSLNIVPLNYYGKTSNDGIDEERLINVIGSDFLYNELMKTQGIIFPYTPSIQGLGAQVHYDSLSGLHSNAPINYYQNTTPTDIQINEITLTADNEDNAKFMVVVLTFLNLCSKCDFGENAKNGGLPPPILYLNGYNSLLNNIPVIITSYSYSLPKDKHYVNTKVNGSSFWLPTELSLSIQLKIQPNPYRTKKEFSLNDIKSGKVFEATNKHGWFW